VKGSPLADLDACEREPLAFSGRIQDVGALFAVDPRTLHVSHFSANVTRWFDLPDDTRELNLQDLFRDDCSYFDYRRRSIFKGRHFVVAGALSNRGIEGSLLIAEATPERVLVEFEPDAPALNPPGSSASVQASDRHLPPSIAIEDTLRRIHDLTTYPKIMLYRFLDAGAGEVVAELSDSQLDSYQGLRFPASDIPRIARNLYIENPFRLIFDTLGAQSPVRAADGDDGILDLSLSTLRSVSPVHVEYLGNMGVRSSASFPVIVMGKLWGLLAMHAVEATPLSIDARIAVARLVEQALARPLMDARIRAEHERFNASVERLEDAAAALAALDRTSRQVQLPSALLQLIPSDDIAVRIDGRLLTANNACSEAEIDDLARLGDGEARRGQFSTDHVSGLLEQDPDFRRRASGLLYAAVDRPASGGRLEILWIRGEVAETVTWAGKPEKTLSVVDGEERISPRRSFDAWQETSEGLATPWLSSDLMLVSRLVVQVLARSRG
jgi:light-regulated signal transduction histidine kinase (bacteriophytochrome)